jgi:glycosyltransferase involved in cell wall biosynthesis
MDVLMLPYYGDANPYQRLLTTALEREGVTVRLDRAGGRRPLATAVSEHGVPNVIHLHWQHKFFAPRGVGPVRTFIRTALFFADVVRLRRAGVRLVWTVHNVVNHERRYERWERLACRCLGGLADGVIVHCETARDVVASAYKMEPGKIYVIEHGHYGDWYPEPVPKRKARRSLGLPRGKRIFLYFGQIRPYKGIEKLLEAFGGLEDDDVHLVLVGRARSTVLKELIRRRQREDSRISAELEYVAEQRLTRYLSACDVAVLPYERSLTSGSGVLAATMGRAVVAPRVGCLGELPDGCAILYDNDVPDGLRSALGVAQTSPLGQMGKRARRHVMQNDWSKVGHKTRHVYEYTCIRRDRYDGHESQR